MKDWNGYQIDTMPIIIGNECGWSYEIYEKKDEQFIPITNELPTEVFETKGRAELAAIGYIYLIKEGGK